jgi:hypothetical protein
VAAITRMGDWHWVQNKWPIAWPRALPFSLGIPMASDDASASAETGVSWIHVCPSKTTDPVGFGQPHMYLRLWRTKFLTYMEPPLGLQAPLWWLLECAINTLRRRLFNQRHMDIFLRSRGRGMRGSWTPTSRGRQHLHAWVRRPLQRKCSNSPVQVCLSMAAADIMTLPAFWPAINDRCVHDLSYLPARPFEPPS